MTYFEENLLAYHEVENTKESILLELRDTQTGKIQDSISISHIPQVMRIGPFFATSPFPQELMV